MDERWRSDYPLVTKEDERGLGGYPAIHGYPNSGFHPTGLAEQEQVDRFPRAERIFPARLRKGDVIQIQRMF